MALDGAMLSLVKREIEENVLGGRVDKIHQPARDTLVIAMRAGGRASKLLLSASGGSPRVHLTSLPVENPQHPPMFCMLLRKHIGASRLSNIRQQGLDRVLFFDFEGLNEMGDSCTVTLVAEIMGRHSNLILVAEDGRIIDSIKRISGDRSSVRLVLPGALYQLPPNQERISLLDNTPIQMVETLFAQPRDVELGQLLQESLEGASPLLCREIAHFSTQGGDRLCSQFTTEEKDRFTFFISTLRDMMMDGGGTPTMVLDLTDKPKDISFIKINQYGGAMKTRDFVTYRALLDNFYGERDAIDRMRQRSGDTLKLVVNRTERIARKLALQTQELEESGHREQLRIFGDLLSAHIHAFKKGDEKADVPNLYEAEAPIVSIPLDKFLTPVQNVQRYYSEYRKADTAEKKLVAMIEEGKQALAYLESVFDTLTRARTEAELDAIRLELASEGYLRRQASGKKEKPVRLTPFKYTSSDGFTILSGRNNVQNDQLTFKEGKNTDIWLHVQKMPGSHTIILTQGAKVPDKTLEEAAIIAAYNSSGRKSSKIPVDYTYIKYIKKPPGAKPGMVIYDNFKTILVDPDEVMVNSLL